MDKWGENNMVEGSQANSGQLPDIMTHGRDMPEDENGVMIRAGGLPDKDNPDWIEASEGRPHPHDNIPWANGAI